MINNLIWIGKFKSGLEPDRLEIEVTENVTLSDPEKTLQTMKSLKKWAFAF